MPSPSIAAGAYAQLARITDGGLGAGSAGPKPTLGLASLGAGPQADEQSFASVLKDAIGSVVEAGKLSDRQSEQMAAGKADVVDVVTAVAETETAIETLVSVRDRVIQSYEEIMRMPI
jgi:flagellar hook-basal body complex protein FliE